MDYTPEGVIDFSQFKKKKEQGDLKPFFNKPMILTLGDPDNPDLQVEYMLLINLVYNDKQILAIERHQVEDDGIAIVEAVIENNAFVGVQPISTDEEYEELTRIISDVLSEQAVKEDGDNDAQH